MISVLNLRGGTNTDMAPQIDAFTEIFLPNLKQFGPEIEYEVKKSYLIKALFIHLKKLVTQFLFK